MNSKLFQLGFDPIYFIIVIGVLSAVAFLIAIILLVKTTKIWRRYDRFMRGKDAESLEEMIHRILNDVEGIQNRQDKIKEELDKVSGQLNASYKKHALLKYNAFKDMGGKLSFSLAMLNEQNDGFILTCMHANGPSYTYLKEIIGGVSYVGLSTEETQVLEEAIHFEAF